MFANPTHTVPCFNSPLLLQGNCAKRGGRPTGFKPEKDLEEDKVKLHKENRVKKAPVVLWLTSRDVDRFSNPGVLAVM
jgi:hypothetical protein